MAISTVISIIDIDADCTLLYLMSSWCSHAMVEVKYREIRGNGEAWKWRGEVTTRVVVRTVKRGMGGVDRCMRRRVGRI